MAATGSDEVILPSGFRRPNARSATATWTRSWSTTRSATAGC